MDPHEDWNDPRQRAIGLEEEFLVDIFKKDDLVLATRCGIEYRGEHEIGKI
jgi:hypothetical protein